MDLVSIPFYYLNSFYAIEHNVKAFPVISTTKEVFPKALFLDSYLHWSALLEPFLHAQIQDNSLTFQKSSRNHSLDFEQAARFREQATKKINAEKSEDEVIRTTSKIFRVVFNSAILRELIFHDGF